MYVDAKTLEEIGLRKGIVANNYKDHFIHCVESFCRYYIQFINGCHYGFYYSPGRQLRDGNRCVIKDCMYAPCLRWEQRDDVLAVAKQIYSKKIIYHKREDPRSIVKDSSNRGIRQPLPFFAIAIYVILKFDNGMTQEWANVREGLSASSMSSILDLWHQIHEFNPFFREDASAYLRIAGQNEDYVGRIKYHILLSSSLRRQLNDAIYKSSIWRFTDSLSFAEIIQRLCKSNSYIRVFFENNPYDNSILARQVQSVIDQYDDEDYRFRLAERKRSAEYKHTQTYGSFALAISIPLPNESGVPELRLLTEVQHEANLGEYSIAEGSPDTIETYNVFFVKCRNSEKVAFKEHQFRGEQFIIRGMPITPVAFFHKYDESLFIQTRDTCRPGDYIIVIPEMEEAKGEFSRWCIASGNLQIKELPKRKSCQLFGTAWCAYYSRGPLNKQYYEPDSSPQVHYDVSDEVFPQGIQDKNRRYFFEEGFPYFEIPARYSIRDTQVRIRIQNGHHKQEFTPNYSVNDRRIIIDLPDSLEFLDQAIYMVTFYCPEGVIPINQFVLWRQAIAYEQDQLYRFNSLGQLINANDDWAFSGNVIRAGHTETIISRVLSRENAELCSVKGNMLLINLLSSCCYNTDTADITMADFRKCLSYTAIHLNVSFSEVESKSNKKENKIEELLGRLSSAGYIQRKYSPNRIQIIPPAFSKAPLSFDGTHQLWLLSGGYTRRFITDLIHYCGNKGIKVYQRENAGSRSAYNAFMPPTVLVGYAFNPEDFKQKSGHQCDIIQREDLALSFLNSSAKAPSVFRLFSFKEINDPFFINSLNELDDPAEPFPRIRKDGLHHYYIESASGCFAGFDVSLLGWAKYFCRVKRGEVIAIKDVNHNIFMPKDVSGSLPPIIMRVLWLMNLGEPENVNAFVCDREDSKDYFTFVKKYRLRQESRVLALISTLTGNDSSLNGQIRDSIRSSGFRMEFWVAKPEAEETIEKWLVLYENDSIIAVGCNFKSQMSVFLKCKGVFLKVAGGMNDTLSLLIKEKWQIEGSTVCIKKDKEWKEGCVLLNESIVLPKKDSYIINRLHIL